MADIDILFCIIVFILLTTAGALLYLVFLALNRYE